MSKEQQSESMHIQVVDVQVIYATSNHFGQIVTASLHLRCKFLCPIAIRHRKDKSEIILGQEFFDAAIWEDCSEIYDDCTRKSSTNTYLLPVQNLTGLILRPIYGKSGSYQRVGVYWIQDQSYLQDCDDNCAKFALAYRSTVCQADHQDFCKTHGENQDDIHHVIELV